MLYGWQIKERGFVEAPESDLNKTVYREKAAYINGPLKEAMIESNCGDDELRYEVFVRSDTEELYEYMVLSIGTSSKYYDITGSSKMACLKLLGQIIF